MAVSKKFRFEVFKRDNFQCQYCGAVPPTIILELDHIQPRAKRGKDNIENLVTSCFDCNRGKSDRLLTSIPKTIKNNADELKEREEQLKEYRKLLGYVRKRQNRDIKRLEDVFAESFPGLVFMDRFKESVRSNFLDKIELSELENHLRYACRKQRYNENKALKYFCGILWRVIRGESNYG